MTRAAQLACGSDSPEDWSESAAQIRKAWGLGVHPLLPARRQPCPARDVDPLRRLQGPAEATWRLPRRHGVPPTVPSGTV